MKSSIRLAVGVALGVLLSAATLQVAIAQPLNLDRGYLKGPRPSDALLYRSEPGKSLTLAASADFSSAMPPVIDQGTVNSCTAWATGYYAFGFLRGEEHGWDPSLADHQFSAMMLYWLCTRGQNIPWTIGSDPETPPSGASTLSAMSWLERKGVCTVSQWGRLWPAWFGRPATTADLVGATHFQTAGRSVLFWNEAAPPHDNDLAVVKEHLQNRHPVVVGFPWSAVANADSISEPDWMYRYGTSPYIGGHAVCLVGFDDTHGGAGAFKFVNSGGTEFGDNGFAWISYDLMRRGVAEAWILTDQQTSPPRLAGGEYFIGPYQHRLTDLDPGEGKATPLSSYGGHFDEAEEESRFSIATDNLAPGLYSLGVRFRSADDTWGPTRRLDIRVDGADVRLTGAEAFFDVDPGQGQGIPVEAADGAFDTATESLAADFTTGSLTQGRRQLFVRVLDSNGLWSLARSATVVVAPPPRIQAAEWTTDQATSPGEGEPLQATDGAFDSSEEWVSALNCAGVWPLGEARVVRVRAQDEFGRWSSNAEFELEEPPPPTPSPTAGPTALPTPPISPSPTPSPTVSLTPSPTTSPAASTSPTESPSPSSSTTPAQTPEPTSAPTEFPSSSPTSTSSPAPSSTPTTTEEPSPSPTASPSPDSSVTPTAFPTTTAAPTATSSVVPTATPQAGIDSDGDGFTDAYEILNNSDPNDPASIPLAALDLNGDGRIDLLDALLFYRHQIGTVPVLPRGGN